MNKRLIIAILIPALALGTWWVIARFSGGGDDRIVLSGNIELTEVGIAFKVPGRLIDLAVDEGDEVQVGQTIARLDPEELLHQRDRARAALAAAESRLDQIRTSIEYLTRTVQGQIDQRKAELDQAEAQLRELVTGSRAQEIEQARAAMERARSENIQARQDWERAQSLFKNGDISRAQYDQAHTRYESSRASLRQAEEQLSLVEEGPRQEEIESGRAQSARALAGLGLAEAQLLEIKQKEQERDMIMADIDRARADLAVIETQLEEAEAVSPIDGVVLVKTAEVGEVLAAGAPVVTIGNLRKPWLRGYINERDLGRVRIGAKVVVTTDSFPGKEYDGRLSFISSEAEFTPKQIQTTEERVKLVYRIKIDIDNPAGELKSNMPADAVIELADR